MTLEFSDDVNNNKINCISLKQKIIFINMKEVL